MKRTTSNYGFGPGLTYQIGPFKTNQNDYPKIQRRPWQGGGVPGGGQAHAGHGNWYISMNPQIFPIQFPMPSSVLNTSKYGSVVSRHNLVNPTTRSHPPGKFNQPSKMIGQPVMQSAPQRPTMGASNLHMRNIQRSDEQADMELSELEPLHEITPQQGVPQTIELEQPFVQPPPELPTVGTGSAVIHPEEVSEEHYAATGPPMYQDPIDMDQVEMYRHTQDNYASLPHQVQSYENDQMINQIRNVEQLARDAAAAFSSLPRTRNDIVYDNPETTSFGDGTDTQVVNQGGDELVPFTLDGGTWITTGGYEREMQRYERQNNRRRRGDLYAVPSRKQRLIESRKIKPKRLLEQAIETAEIENSIKAEQAIKNHIPMEDIISRAPMDDIVHNRMEGPQNPDKISPIAGVKRKITFNDFRTKNRKVGDERHVVQEPVEVRIAKALAKGARRRGRNVNVGIRVGEGPSVQLKLPKGKTSNKENKKKARSQQGNIIRYPV